MSGEARSGAARSDGVRQCKDDVLLHVWVHNDHTFEIKEEDIFLDCWPNCTGILKKILDQKGDILRNRIQENLSEIKDWLLEEIKNDKGEK